MRGLLINVLVVAQSSDWDGHHGDWGGGWWIVMLLFWVLVAAGIVWAISRASRSQPDERRAGATPLEILERRLAEGSISVEEYEERRRALAGSGHPEEPGSG